jgi:hypothetical protein
METRKEYRIRIGDIPESLYCAIMEEFERQWGYCPGGEFEEEFWVVAIQKGDAMVSRENRKRYCLRIDAIPESLYHAIWEEFERQWGYCPDGVFEKEYWVIAIQDGDDLAWGTYPPEEEALSDEDLGGAQAGTP